MHPFRRPCRISRGHDLPHASPGCALARLGGLADEDRVEIGAVAIALDPVMGPATDRITRRDEVLRQDRYNVGLGVWADRPHRQRR